MKRTQRNIPIWLFSLTLYGCTPGIKVSCDYDRAADFSNYKTYALADIKGKGEVSELNAARIMKAIRENMAKKGFTETNADADMLVNAVTILKNKQSVTATTDYYGYGGLYRPYGYWGSSSYTTFNTYNYVDGSLIIDIVNNKAQKLLWHGIGNAEIDKMPGNPDQFISNAVSKILAGFPPKPSKK